MNQHQIDKIKALDKDGCDGSVQQVLLREDLAQIPFADACFHIARCLKNDKTALAEENKKLVTILKKHNLYTSEELFGDQPRQPA